MLLALALARCAHFASGACSFKELGRSVILPVRTPHEHQDLAGPLQVAIIAQQAQRADGCMVACSISLLLPYRVCQKSCFSSFRQEPPMQMQPRTVH